MGFVFNFPNRPIIKKVMSVFRNFSRFALTLYSTLLSCIKFQRVEFSDWEKSTLLYTHLTICIIHGPTITNICHIYWNNAGDGFISRIRITLSVLHPRRRPLKRVCAYGSGYGSIGRGSLPPPNGSKGLQYTLKRKVISLRIYSILTSRGLSRRAKILSPSAVCHSVKESFSQPVNPVTAITPGTHDTGLRFPISQLQILHLPTPISTHLPSPNFYFRVSHLPTHKFFFSQLFLCPSPISQVSF